MFNVKKQLSKLYTSAILGNLSLSGAWVAILAARGFSLVQIGIAETVYHITSLIFEIPSGVFADVIGRKKMLVISTFLQLIGCSVMICSTNLFGVCLSIAFFAMSDNAASGTGDALAYDSLKLCGEESKFEKYASNQLIIYRMCEGVSTLCAGFALFIGYKLAYGASFISCAIQLPILFSLHEVYASTFSENAEELKKKSMHSRIAECFKESFMFLMKVKKALGLMFCNSFVGALDIVLLFFLQAKLPARGIPTWLLGAALLFMQLGGVTGSKLILKFPKAGYKCVFAVTTILVIIGLLLEHSPFWALMALGGFIAALGDDALQIRTNARLQDMFPSEQRATLVSVESFTFSVIMIVLSPLAGFVFTYW